MRQSIQEWTKYLVHSWILRPKYASVYETSLSSCKRNSARVFLCWNNHTIQYISPNKVFFLFLFFDWMWIPRSVMHKSVLKKNLSSYKNPSGSIYTFLFKDWSASLLKNDTMASTSLLTLLIFLNKTLAAYYFWFSRDSLETFVLSPILGK